MIIQMALRPTQPFQTIQTSLLELPSCEMEVPVSDPQNELKALQKKCRVLEVNRNVHLEDSQRTIAQQQKIIDKLKYENKKLKTELNLETKTKYAAPSMLQQQRVVDLNDMVETFTSKIEVERRRVEELEKTIDVCRAKAFETRKKVGGANSAEVSLKEAAKNMKLLENRLDQMLQSFNETISHNKKLRQEIDDMQRERSSLEQIYRRMEKCLVEQRKEMSDTLEATNVAYEARDQAESEVASLRAQGDHEQALFDSEMKELTNLIEADQQIFDSSGRHGARANVNSQSCSANSNKALDRASVNSWDIGITYSEDYVDNAFLEAMELAGTSDLDEFVAVFREREKRNFLLFSACNDLDHEIRDTEHQIQKLDEERLAIENEARNGHGNEMVKALNQKRDQAKVRLTGFLKTHKSNERIMKDLRVALQGVVHRSGLKVDFENGENLGEGILQHLAALEAGARELTEGMEESAAGC
ncbi:hypothetical protein BSKO_09066 [Bryopsis sp. KO-2023]|nr:hypothetical protein BSKO_09066 [Bryopsis sp. KO-2023]